MNFPVIADEDGEIHRMVRPAQALRYLRVTALLRSALTATLLCLRVQFGMIPTHAPPGEAAVYKRPFTSLIIVDDMKTVRLQTLYPATTGRNFFEAIRCLESLQVCRHHQVSPCCRCCPLAHAPAAHRPALPLATPCYPPTPLLQVGTPANWSAGEDTFIDDAVASADAKDLFEKGFAEILPYFRITPMPDLPDGMRREE